MIAQNSMPKPSVNVHDKEQLSFDFSFVEKSIVPTYLYIDLFVNDTF